MDRCYQLNTSFWDIRQILQFFNIDKLALNHQSCEKLESVQGRYLVLDWVMIMERPFKAVDEAVSDIVETEPWPLSRQILSGLISVNMNENGKQENC